MQSSKTDTIDSENQTNTFVCFIGKSQDPNAAAWAAYYAQYYAQYGQQNQYGQQPQQPQQQVQQSTPQQPSMSALILPSWRLIYSSTYAEL